MVFINYGMNHKNFLIYLPAELIGELWQFYLSSPDAADNLSRFAELETDPTFYKIINHQTSMRALKAAVKSRFVLKNEKEVAAALYTHNLKQYLEDYNKNHKEYGWYDQLIDILKNDDDIFQDRYLALIANPFLFNYITKKKYPELVWQAGLGKSKIVKKLLEAGADPNATNPTGNTALIRSVLFADSLSTKENSSKFLETVQILIAYGADPFIKNKEGKTAIEVSRIPGITKFLKYIMN